MVRLLGFLVVGGLLGSSLGQDKWCNKNYKQGTPIVPPGGQFPVPATSYSKLLAFRCTPIYKPYIAEDLTNASNNPGFIFDTLITNTQVQDASPIDLVSTVDFLLVSISTGEGVKLVVDEHVPVNATKFEIPFSLAELTPRQKPYDISCSATYPTSAGAQEYTADASLSYLPNPPSGSITKFDSRTAGLWTKQFGGDVDYTPVFPVGFYTDFDDYLAKNLSILDDLKARGINLVHPVPTFDNLTALNLVLDRMEELGLYLMYDMRWIYQNLSAVEEEVSRIKSRKNLLLWYTADEPDGSGDPLHATGLTYDKIYDIDGYHPVSLVLNCQDYEFQSYAIGADIVMQDTYMIGINATYSVVWNTTCTADYGDCGCDNCVGEFEDISRRVDQFGDRLRALALERTTVVWTVPQAFGDDTYWSRIPTGKEWVVQSFLAVVHGALGIVSWNDPTSSDIKAATTAVSHQLLPDLTSFALDPCVVFTTHIFQRVHIGIWELDGRTLVVGVNLDPHERKIQLTQLPVWEADANLRVVYNGGVSFESDDLVFEDLGSVGFTVEK